MATEDLTRVLDEAGARYAPFARAHRERRRRGGSAQARAGRRGEDAVLTTPGRDVRAVLPASERIDLHKLPEAQEAGALGGRPREHLLPSTGIEQQKLRNAAPSLPTASRG